MFFVYQCDCSNNYVKRELNVYCFQYLKRQFHLSDMQFISAGLNNYRLKNKIDQNNKYELQENK